MTPVASSSATITTSSAGTRGHSTAPPVVARGRVAHLWLRGGVAVGSKLVSHLNMHARAGSTVELEQRAYGPESTREEREAIAERVSVVDDRILLIHELPVQSPFSVKLMFDRFHALAQDWDRLAYVVDLTEAKRPDPETRAALKAQTLGISPRVTHLAVAVGDNLLMRAMAQLFAYSMGLTNVSTHATRAEAIEEARRAMAR